MIENPINRRVYKWAGNATPPEQIIRLLRQVEVLSSEGRNVPEICRELGITANTYCRWRKDNSFTFGEIIKSNAIFSSGVNSKFMV